MKLQQCWGDDMEVQGNWQKHWFSQCLRILIAYSAPYKILNQSQSVSQIHEVTGYKVQAMYDGWKSRSHDEVFTKSAWPSMFKKSKTVSAVRGNKFANEWSYIRLNAWDHVLSMWTLTSLETHVLRTAWVIYGKLISGVWCFFCLRSLTATLERNSSTRMLLRSHDNFPVSLFTIEAVHQIGRCIRLADSHGISVSIRKFWHIHWKCNKNTMTVLLLAGWWGSARKSSQGHPWKGKHNHCWWWKHTGVSWGSCEAD